MTDLTPQQPRAVAATKRSLPDLQRHLEAEHLLRDVFPAVLATRWPAMPALEDWHPRHWKISTLEKNQADVAEALQVAAPRGVLLHFAERVRSAMDAVPDRKSTTAALALLLDSRTKQPPNASVYLDAATYDLVDEGFSPAVVVMAMQRLRRESVWLPEIAELVAACRKERDRLANALYRAEKALKEREALERYQLIAFDEMARVMALPESEETPIHCQ